MQRVARSVLPISASANKLTTATSMFSEDQVRILFVESGSADLATQSGHAVAVSGDIVLLGPGFKCTMSSATEVRLSVLSVNSDYLVDTIFWQYPYTFIDRVMAKKFVREKMSGKAHHVRLNADWSKAVGQPLAAICSLSAAKTPLKNICQIQAHWHLITDQIFPFLVEKPLCTWRDTRKIATQDSGVARDRYAVVRGEAA